VSNPRDSEPRYRPHSKKNGDPAYVGIPQALAFGLIAYLAGPALKVAMVIAVATYQFDNAGGAPRPISYSEFASLTNLNPRAIRAGLMEGIDRYVIGVLPGSGTRESSYSLRPLADWKLQEAKHKRFTSRSASTSPSEVERFTSRSAALSLKQVLSTRNQPTKEVALVEDQPPRPKSGHQLLGEYRQEMRRRQAAGQPPALSMLPDAIPDERATVEETA
jgi:hypothetical protein